MILLVSATELEMMPLKRKLSGLRGVNFLITGIGLVETAVSLTRFLAERPEPVTAVIDFGAAGAYPERGVELLDICLATREVLGDFGIWYDHGIEGFSGTDLVRKMNYDLRLPLLPSAAEILRKGGITPHLGTFVTVQGASGTGKRGRMLRDRYDAICENMEGAAAARACEQFALPFLEVRCVSNAVEDRNLENWRLAEACDRCAEAVAILVAGLRDRGLSAED